MFGKIAASDLRVMRRANSWFAPRWIRWWMMGSTRAGDGWVWYIVGAIILLFGGSERFYALASGGSAALLSIGLFLVLKRLINRKRPCEIASHCWRRATFGLRPPPALRGRMGGIYHRPRFLAAPKRSPDRWMKSPGFQRLLREGWWRQMLFVDEFLAAELQSVYPSSPIFFLPDPCPPGYDGDPITARNKLEIPRDRKVLLFYGTGARRKGLHLAVEAMRQLPPESPAFLLCAGQQNPSGKTAAALAQLVRQNRACLLDRYVTVEEEKMCFAASDAVLLPYLNHFGTSGVLSRAMSAARPVITSDEQLLGRLTREHRLGLVFPPGNIPALRDCISQMAQLSATGAAPFAAAARDYAKTFSREAFRAALLESLAPRTPDSKRLPP